MKGAEGSGESDKRSDQAAENVVSPKAMFLHGGEVPNCKCRGRSQLSLFEEVKTFSSLYMNFYKHIHIARKWSETKRGIRSLQGRDREQSSTWL